MRNKTMMAKILSAALAVLLLGGSFGLPAAAIDELWIDPVLLSKTEGGVAVTNGGGHSLSMQENMSLSNGNRLETAAGSYAWLNLYGGQLAKLGASGTLEVRESDSGMELLLQPGSLFFHTAEPPEEDMVMNLRAATASADIRQASGWMSVTDRWNARLFVLTGTAECAVTDPVTGQIKTAAVGSGQSAVLAVYPEQQSGIKCDILLEDFAAEDIDGYVLTELAQDIDLCGQLYENTGMDPLAPLGLLGSVQRQLTAADEQLLKGRQLLEEANDKNGARTELEAVAAQLGQLAALLDADVDLSQARQALEEDDLSQAAEALVAIRAALEPVCGEQIAAARPQAAARANDRLDQDERKASQLQADIDEQAAQLESSVAETEAWVPTPSPSPSPSPAPAGGGGASPTFRPAPVATPVPSPSNVTKSLVLGSFTISQLQQLLNDTTVAQVILLPSEDPALNALNIDSSLLIHAGQKLTVSGEGITVTVAPSVELTVAGSLSAPGSVLENNGTIHVDGSATLAAAQVHNNAGGILTVAGLGALTCSEMTNSGQMTSAGVLTGVMTNSGTLSVTDGSLSGLLTQAAGTAAVSGGSLAGGVNVSGGAFTLAGGEVHKGILQTDAEAVPSTVTITGGTVTGGYYYNPYNCADSSLMMTGGTVQYMAEEAVGTNISAALTVADSQGKVTVTGGVLDGAGKPAVGFVGQLAQCDVAIGGQAVVKSARPQLTQSSNGRFTYYDLAIQPTSIVTARALTEEEGGGYTILHVYDALALAMTGSEAGEVIPLQSDYTIPSAVITNGEKEKPVVLDLNGRKLTLTDGPISLLGALSIIDTSPNLDGVLISDAAAEGSCVITFAEHADYDVELQETWKDFLTFQNGLEFRFKCGVFILDKDGTVQIPDGYLLTPPSTDPDADPALKDYYTLTMPEPTPEPSTSPEPTATPEPTASPEPSTSPEPTAESEPTAPADPPASPEVSAEPETTATSEPTETPAPSDAAGDPGAPEDPSNGIEPAPVAPTDTSVPADTAAPTDTPAPSDTVVPSDTEEPTDTPTPSDNTDPTDNAEPSGTPETEATPEAEATATPDPIPVAEQSQNDEEAIA